jgi:CRISPR system Cascade subunit CasC
LTLSAIEAFTKAMVRAIPTGKQNSFAAHNAPDFVGICLRKAAPMSLANAFEKPVAPRRDQSITELSVAALAAYDEKLSCVYGTPSDQWLLLDLTGQWPTVKGAAADSLSTLSLKARELVSSQMES